MKTSLDLLKAIEKEYSESASTNRKTLSECAMGFSEANNHFRYSKVIIINYQIEYDYDGLHRHLKLIQGFREEDKALKYFDEYANLALNRLALDMKAENNENWYIEEIGPNYRLETKSSTDYSRRLALSLAKVTNHNGFEWVDCEIAAITVNPDQPVGKALFSQIRNEWEWNYYLSNFSGPEI